MCNLECNCSSFGGRPSYTKLSGSKQCSKAWESLEDPIKGNIYFHIMINFNMTKVAFSLRMDFNANSVLYKAMQLQRALSKGLWEFPYHFIKEEPE